MSRSADTEPGAGQDDLDGSLVELVVLAVATCYGKGLEDAEWTSVGRQGRAPERLHGRCVDDHRQLAGFLVSHPGDAQPSVQLAKSTGESFCVLSGGSRDEVEVVGLTVSSVDL